MRSVRLRYCGLLLAALALVVAGTGTSYAAEKHPFGWGDSSSLHRARAIAVSPDGKSILYRVAYGAAKGPEKHEWWLIGSSGEAPHKLELPEKFTPNGFTRQGALYGGYQVDKQGQLAIVPLEEGQPTRILTLPSGIGSAAI